MPATTPRKKAKTARKTPERKVPTNAMILAAARKKAATAAAAFRRNLLVAAASLGRIDLAAQIRQREQQPLVTAQWAELERAS